MKDAKTINFSFFELRYFKNIWNLLAQYIHSRATVSCSQTLIHYATHSHTIYTRILNIGNTLDFPTLYSYPEDKKSHFILKFY
jgi:hypothetical protein